MLRIFNIKRNQEIVVQILGGSIGGLGVANNLWIILMPFALFIMWFGVGNKYSNFFWGFSFVFVSHFWLFHLHPLTWLGFPWILSILIPITILIICSMIGGSFVLSWSWITGKFISKKDFFSRQPPITCWIRIILMSLIWAFGELILTQTSLFWIGVGESLIPGDLFLAGLARWFGTAGICSLQILLGFWIFLIFERWRRKLEFRKLLIVGIIVLISLHTIGALILIPKKYSANYSVAIWQTNIPTRKKLSISDKEIINRLNREQKKALSQNADLLIAPEGTLRENSILKNDSEINSLIGGFRKDKNVLKSSLLAFQKGDKLPSAFIDKTRIVPLGEKVPRFLNSMGLSSIGGIDSGSKSRLFEWVKTPPFAVAICYEITDGLKIKNAIQNGGELILSIANLDPYPPILFKQFLSLARMRSIENKRDIIIASNTGPSGLIKNDGSIHKLFNYHDEQTKTLETTLLNEPTFYNKYGNKPLFVIFILLFSYVILNKKLTNNSST